MSDPTPAHIQAALARAKDLVQGEGFDLMRALAEATTTAQCEGVQGFKVFAGVRDAIPGCHLITDTKAAVKALDAAIKQVTA